MQIDPTGQANGLNIYAYVMGDPVNFSDWSGLGDNQFPNHCEGNFCPDHSTTQTIVVRLYGSCIGCVSGWGHAGQLLAAAALASRLNISGRAGSALDAQKCAAIAFHDAYGPNATGDQAERAAIPQGSGPNYSVGEVQTGPSDGSHITWEGPIVLGPGNWFESAHVHSGAAGDQAPFLSQQDFTQGGIYEHLYGSRFGGMYLSTPQGVFGPPWTDLGAPPNQTRNGQPVIPPEHVYSGTPVVPPRSCRPRGR